MLPNIKTSPTVPEENIKDKHVLVEPFAKIHFSSNSNIHTQLNTPGLCFELEQLLTKLTLHCIKHHPQLPYTSRGKHELKLRAPFQIFTVIKIIKE